MKALCKIYQFGSINEVVHYFKLYEMAVKERKDAKKTQDLFGNIGNKYVFSR